MRPLKENRQITVIVGLVVRRDKILMVKRFEPEVEGAHLKWEFPGGKVDFGETPEKALLREIKEETGVAAKIKRLLPISYTKNWDYSWGVQHTILFGYECEFIKEEKRKPDHHVNEVKWVDFNDFYSFEVLPGGKEFFDSLRG